MISVSFIRRDYTNPREMKELQIPPLGRRGDLGRDDSLFAPLASTRNVPCYFFRCYFLVVSSSPQGLTIIRVHEGALDPVDFAKMDESCVPLEIDDYVTARRPFSGYLHIGVITRVHGLQIRS